MPAARGRKAARAVCGNATGSVPTRGDCQFGGEYAAIALGSRDAALGDAAYASYADRSGSRFDQPSSGRRAGTGHDSTGFVRSGASARWERCVAFNTAGRASFTECAGGTARHTDVAAGSLAQRYEEECPGNDPADDSLGGDSLKRVC